MRDVNVKFTCELCAIRCYKTISSQSGKGDRHAHNELAMVQFQNSFSQNVKTH